MNDVRVGGRERVSCGKEAASRSSMPPLWTSGREELSEPALQRAEGSFDWLNTWPLLKRFSKASRTKNKYLRKKYDKKNRVWPYLDKHQVEELRERERQFFMLIHGSRCEVDELEDIFEHLTTPSTMLSWFPYLDSLFDDIDHPKSRDRINVIWRIIKIYSQRDQWINEPNFRKFQKRYISQQIARSLHKPGLMQESELTLWLNKLIKVAKSYERRKWKVDSIDRWNLELKETISQKGLESNEVRRLADDFTWVKRVMDHGHEELDQKICAFYEPERKVCHHRRLSKYRLQARQTFFVWSILNEIEERDRNEELEMYAPLFLNIREVIVGLVRINVLPLFTRWLKENGKKLSGNSKIGSVIMEQSEPGVGWFYQYLKGEKTNETLADRLFTTFVNSHPDLGCPEFKENYRELLKARVHALPHEEREARDNWRDIFEVVNAVGFNHLERACQTGAGESSKAVVPVLLSLKGPVCES